MVEADIREPEVVLNHPETRRLIDFGEPAGLLIVAVTHFVSDEDDPWGVVRRYVDALVPGSYLVLAAATADRQAERKVDSVVDVYNSSTTPLTGLRSRTEIERFFGGLEIVPPYEGAEPALTYAGLWGCEDPEEADTDGSRWVYAAVARKPEEMA
jgi:hypothetical protein